MDRGECYMKDPTVIRLMRAVGSRKRSAHYVVTDRVELHGTYWDGGSRSTYTAVRLSDGRTVTAPQYDPPQFGGPRTAPTCEVPEGICIVSHGTFCGKPATPCFYINPADATRLLPLWKAPEALPTGL